MIYRALACASGVMALLVTSGCSGDPYSSGIFYSSDLASQERTVMNREVDGIKTANSTLSGNVTSAERERNAQRQRLAHYQGQLSHAQRDLSYLKKMAASGRSKYGRNQGEIQRMDSMLGNLQRSQPDLRSLQKLRRNLSQEIQTLEASQTVDF